MRHLQLHITLKHLLINHSKMIGLQFYPNKVIQRLVKTLPSPRWSKKYNMVYIKNNQENLTQIFETFRGIAWVDTHYFITDKPIKNNPKLNIDCFRNRTIRKGYKACPEEFLEKLELKRYAFNTAKTYITLFENFINRFKEVPVSNLTEVEIRLYLKELHDEGKSNSYLHLVINSIKFYYEAVLNMPHLFYSIERPRIESKLPKVLSPKEVKLLINSTNNIKHKCIISLLYSAGLRRSELINLEIDHIDSDRMLILVSHAKGNKDRYTLLSEATLRDLRIYFKQWKPKQYLFEGIRGGKYSPTSVLSIVKTAAVKAGIKKRVTPHMLRHSFATHLLENNVDIRYIQSLLGHSSTTTTEIYTQVAINHVQNVKSPLDYLP